MIYEYHLSTQMFIWVRKKKVRNALSLSLRGKWIKGPKEKKRSEELKSQRKKKNKQRKRKKKFFINKSKTY